MIRYLLLLVVSFFNCSKEPALANEKNTIHILYVGNSLTYTNDLPALIKELASQDGVAITSSSLTLPNYSFEDHWNDGLVQQEIETGKFDFVIGQQGPSALPASQVLLLDYSTRLANICKAKNTKFALCTVWPSADRLFDLDNVIFSYKNAATQTGSLLCAAGLAWKHAWAADPGLGLYSFDGFHPSLLGSVLAALTIYGALKDKNDFDFIKHTDVSWKNSVSVEQFNKLKAAALKALDK
jgi:hypothetical protein